MYKSASYSDNEKAYSIDDLRGRFINLKNENKKLNKRKNEINERMEEVKVHERQ